MNRLLPSVAAIVLTVLLWVGMALAQAAPPLTPVEKEKAAAIELPKTFTPPPLPGQLQPPASKGTEPAAPVPLPPPATGDSASKMPALGGGTQPPALQEAPRVSAPSDRLPVTSSTSTTGQFIVHGKVFETRSAMSSRCEEISTELRKVLNDREPWVLPVVVLLNMGDEALKSKAATVSTAISEMTHGGFHLQVTVNDRPGISAADLRKEFVRALLAERILRNHQKIATPEGRLLLPDWVMTGVLHAMDYKASARPSALFATIFRSGKIYGIEEIIAASPVEMDGLSRTIYETSCCALVLALVDQPDGPARFNKFLNSLATDPRSERQLLDAAFPNFAASASSLNKWWSLQLAALSKPGIAEPYTPADSIKAIEDAILIRYEAPAAEVPKNIKLRPFVLPSKVAFTPPTKPAAEAALSADAPPRTKPAPKEKSEGNSSEAEAGAEEAETPKRSLWRRLLFLGESSPEEKPSEEKTSPDGPDSADMPPETAATEPAEGKPGFLGRIFGGGKDEKSAEKNSEAKDKPKTETKPGEEKPTPATDTKPAEEKPKPAAEPKPKPSAEPEPATEEKKPSKLNPLNWFRGDKKPAEEPKEEKPAGEEQASSHPVPALDLPRLLSPALTDVWHALTPAVPRPTVEPLLNFLKRRPKTDEAKTDDDEKKAGDSKPAPQKEDKPRTTNPKAKPAAKKQPSAAGAPKTTNPNAKPLPPGSVPPAGETIGGSTPDPKNGLVKVVLPLEDYRFILKHPDRVAILNQNVATLRALELRVGVLFRPVITGYLAATLDLQEGKAKDMDKRLALLRELALAAYQKSVAVRDYLDWFQASESSGLSGKFDEFLNLPAIIEKELPPREDPISKYLDAIDKEFSK